MTVRLFVYGTLAPGRDAWPVLESWVVGTPRADAVEGRLYDTGRGYPAAQFGRNPQMNGIDALVHGTIVTLSPERAEEALIVLDRYEGHEYERIAVRTVAGLDAATYAWISPLHECRPVPDGHWRS